MVISIPTPAQRSQKRRPDGPRPINLNKDVPQVIKLLELVFGHKLGGDGQHLFSGEAGFTQPAFLWRLKPMSNKLALGYVWEEDGRIVGNATLLATRRKDRFLVVNVAVHPDYRRRGIARGLMLALIELTQAKHGREILLQVVKDNEPAVKLYADLRFKTLGHMTVWSNNVSRLRDIESSISSYDPVQPIRELPRNWWRAAYQLDARALPLNLNWPEPLPHDAYKLNFWRRMDNFLNGRHAEVWATTNEANQLTGLASIWSEWGRPHQITLRVHPAWQGLLERPLLAKVIRRLRYLPRRSIRLEHPDSDKLTNELLREANFQPRRTLTHMRLDITAQ